MLAVRTTNPTNMALNPPNFPSHDNPYSRLSCLERERIVKFKVFELNKFSKETVRS